ncbi:carboxypeptidase-like regulatory domain-containing protein [Pseudogracilibacillus sp. SE30717A]|uniref:carboxypeptidase-like regulatory domain-containing protein n=1 Tax=Pseudogracilibacillus sp. SE30717A TaxID=3098293 RepID=UPI00300E4C2D
MKKVKLKVKHLIWLFTGIITIYLLIIFLIQPQISLYVAKKKWEEGDIAGKEQMINLMNANLFTSQKWELITDYMLDYSLASQFDVIVGPSFSQVSGLNKESSFTWEEKLPFLEQYVEKGPINGYLVTVASELAYYYERSGDYNRATQVIEEAIGRFSNTENYWDQKELQLERAKMEVNRSNYEKAESLIDEMLDSIQPDEYYFHAEIAQLKVNTLIKQGKIQTALEEVERALKEYEEQWTKDTNNDVLSESINNSVVYEELLVLEQMLKQSLQLKEFETGNVEGRIIRKDGTPVANVGVFLRAESDVNRSLSWNEPYKVITDENGYFEFPTVIPGSYQIFLGFSFDQIDGWTWPVQMDDWIDVTGTKNITYDITLHKLINIKSPTNQEVINDQMVNFEWEEVEDAAYYAINLGIELESASISTEFKSQIKENNIQVPIEDFYAKTVSMIFPEDNLEEIHSQSSTLLAFANTEGIFFWSVEAYDQNDNLLSRSNGYRLNEDSIGELPFFYLKERELTDADQLLLNNKIEEALHSYEEAYKSDQNDIHSLRMISRLIGLKAKDEAMERKLVMPFLIDLVDKHAATADDVWRLVEYYYDLEDWHSFNNYFEQYSTMLNGDISEYDKALYAKSLMKQGDIQSAETEWIKVMEMDKSNQFIGDLIAINLYLHESIPKALILAETYPERSHGEEQKTNWITILRQMQNEAAQTEDYTEGLKDILALYMIGENKEVMEQLNKSDQPALKDFINALRKMN